MERVVLIWWRRPRCCPCRRHRSFLRVQENASLQVDTSRIIGQQHQWQEIHLERNERRAFLLPKDSQSQSPKEWRALARQWRRSSPTSSSTRAGWVLSVMPSWRAATIPCFLPGSFLRPELIGISLCKSTIWIHFVFCVMFFIKMLKKHVVGGLYIYIYIYYIYILYIVI